MGFAFAFLTWWWAVPAQVMVSIRRSRPLTTRTAESWGAVLAPSCPATPTHMSLWRDQGHGPASACWILLLGCRVLKKCSRSDSLLFCASRPASQELPGCRPVRACKPGPRRCQAVWEASENWGPSCHLSSQPVFTSRALRPCPGS